MDSSILPHALNYAEKWNWSVFPGRMKGKAKASWKSAETSNGVNWGATRNLDEIRTDFADPTHQIIGIPTGADNRIFVLDVDTTDGHKYDGFASLATLEAQHGKLPDTLMAESPSGSRHYFFRHPGFYVKGSAGTDKKGLAPGVDIKGDGGMVFAPPSVKPGGGKYEWLNAPHAIAEAPAWLLEWLKDQTGADEVKPLSGTSRVAPTGLRPSPGTHAAKVLETACQKVAATEAGRNTELNNQALLVGRYVGNGEIGVDVAEHDLLAACDENGLLAEDGEQQCLATIRSGIGKGRKDPARTTDDMFGGVAAVVAPMVKATEKTTEPRYLFETVADLRNLPAATWLVEGWIPEQGVGLIYGAYASGKSFILFDLLLHLAYGLKEWHGVKLPSIPCNVLLIAREGSKGFQGRVDAFKAHHGISDDTDRLVFMRSPTNMGDRAQFAELKTAVEKCGRKFGVVGVDTVGRALPGEDFYDPKSITAFMEHLQQLGDISNGVAIGVHHENRSGDIFGSVYFGASSDFMFQVEREGDPKKDPLRRGKITCTKMKDGEDGWKKRVDYQKVASSLVVSSIGEAAGLLGETKKLSPDDKLAMRALGEAMREVGKSRPEMPGRTVTIDQWLDRCFKIGGVSPDAAKPRRDLHRRQVNLLANGLILVQDDLVRIIDHASAATTAPAMRADFMPGGITPGMSLPPIPQRPYQ